MKARWTDVIPRALQFVTEQGRMKFVRPIYRSALRQNIGHFFGLTMLEKCKILFLAHLGDILLEDMAHFLIISHEKLWESGPNRQSFKFQNHFIAISQWTCVHYPSPSWLCLHGYKTLHSVMLHCQSALWCCGVYSLNLCLCLFHTWWMGINQMRVYKMRSVNQQHSIVSFILFTSLFSLS